MDERRDLDYYLSLPYTIQFRRDEDAWFAEVVELPGCMTEEDTLAEAAEMIVDAMKGWIEIALEDGLPIPEPRPVEEYSGKFVVRVPRSLHRELVQRAAREDVSLNQYVNVALAKAVGPSLPHLPAARVAIAQEASTVSQLAESNEAYHTGKDKKRRRARVYHEDTKTRRGKE